MQSTSIKKIYSNIDSIIAGEKTRKSIRERLGGIKVSRMMAKMTDFMIRGR